MQDMPLIINLSVALAIGILIGVERGWHERHLNTGQRIAGIRTFALIGFLGGLLSCTPQIMPWAFVAGILAISALFGVGWYRFRTAETDIGITTIIAALVTYALGGLAAQGALVAAGAGAVVTSLLLYFKPALHSILEKVREAEINAGLRLLAISVLLLPILPDQGYGPWQVFNPYEIWVMVVAIAGLSFAGYLMIRLFGAQRGLLFAAMAGALVSSTAVTVSFAQQSRKAKSSANAYLLGIVAANFVMFPRVLIISAVIAPDLLYSLGPAVGLATIVGAGMVALLLWRGHKNGGHEPDVTNAIENPLQLKTAIIFGGLLSLILLAARAAVEYLGSSGIYGLAVLSGFADVDPITLSIASNAAEGIIAVDVAGGAIILAAIANTFVKMILAIRLADEAIRVQLGVILSLYIVAAVAGLGHGIILLL